MKGRTDKTYNVKNILYVYYACVYFIMKLTN